MNSDESKGYVLLAGKSSRKQRVEALRDRAVHYEYAIREPLSEAQNERIREALEEAGPSGLGGRDGVYGPRRRSNEHLEDRQTTRRKKVKMFEGLTDAERRQLREDQRKLHATLEAEDYAQDENADGTRHYTRSSS
jgi:hypothetical protein